MKTEGSMAGHHTEVVFVRVKCQNQTMRKRLCHSCGSVSASSFHLRKAAAPAGDFSSRVFFFQYSEFGN